MTSSDLRVLLVFTDRCRLHFRQQIPPRNGGFFTFRMAEPRGKLLANWFCTRYHVESAASDFCVRSSSSSFNSSVFGWLGPRKRKLFLSSRHSNANEQVKSWLRPWVFVDLPPQNFNRTRTDSNVFPATEIFCCSPTVFSNLSFSSKKKKARIIPLKCE